MTDKKKTPLPLRPAATVILARERNNALEFYLLKRSTKSGFMGGLYVFPGGAVDPEDKNIRLWEPAIDMSITQIKEQFGGNGVSCEEAFGFRIAAIRETLEEAGVLIAADKNKTKKNIEDICTFRLNKNLPKSWFRTKMVEENWTLSLSSLGKWSHWIAPKLMKKRFDTRFFIVLMPEDQACIPDNVETKHGIWLPPQEALEQNLEAKTPLSPPAVVTLTQLLGFKNLEELKKEIQTRSWGDPIAPRFIPSPNGPVILEPWDPMRYEEGELDFSDISKKVIAPGAWFSRIWCDNGVWKPVTV